MIANNNLAELDNTPNCRTIEFSNIRIPDGNSYCACDVRQLNVTPVRIGTSIEHSNNNCGQSYFGSRSRTAKIHVARDFGGSVLTEKGSAIAAR